MLSVTEGRGPVSEKDSEKDHCDEPDGGAWSGRIQVAVLERGDRIVIPALGSGLNTPGC